MKITVFSTQSFERAHLEEANAGRHELLFIPTYLTPKTAVLAKDSDAVALFVNDNASAEVLRLLKAYGVKYIACRSAGVNHVDLHEAAALGLKVAHVPEYSPYSVAEHTVALMLALNRKLIKANNRVRELNFSLDGLTGFDMHGKTVGIIGGGTIGAKVANIMHGFGCHLLCYDRRPDEALVINLQLEYTQLDDLCSRSDIITLHVPLNKHTHYIISKERIAKMKRGVMLINTSRGALVDTKAVIEALKTGHIAYLGLDVYEEEAGLFFEDHSDSIIQDDVIARLLTFPNVLITSHQAFLTDTALKNIADTTLYNIKCWQEGIKSRFELT